MGDSALGQLAHSTLIHGTAILQRLSHTTTPLSKTDSTTVPFLMLKKGGVMSCI